ncbi:MATE family efflux transporter [Azospirillum sp. ST 5-10]|uniref:MATE family efflux transporter n=1 Tax=unclassified Azospirillum TaxID=2630922 RepID=UPI003F4A3023
MDVRPGAGDAAVLSGTPLPSPPAAPARVAAAAERKARTREALLSGAILPTMTGLALPTIGVLFAQTLVGVAEAFYVGFLGTDALVGVALVFPVWMLMTMTSAGGVGNGVAAAVARAIGSGRHDDADALARHALVLAVVLGLLFTAGTLLLGPRLYRALGGDGGALEAALVYSGFVFAGAVPIWIVNLLSAALRGAGNVRVPALVTLVGAVVLIPLSPALIFGVGPVPRFGIAGAGIALAAYYAAAAVALLAHMAGGRSDLVLRPGRLEARLFRDILGIGVISALSAVQLNLTVILVTGAVGRFGPAALAGYGAAARLDYLLIPLLFGLGTAVLTMVGANTGAGHLRRARRIAWIGALAGAGLAELIGLAAAFAPSLWLGLFSADPAVLADGALYLRVVAPLYAAVGATFILGFASQGGGRPLWPFLAGTARLAIAAGLGWLAVDRFAAGLDVLFAIVAASSVVSALVCVAATWTGAVWRTAPGRRTAR